MRYRSFWVLAPMGVGYVGSAGGVFVGFQFLVGDFMVFVDVRLSKVGLVFAGFGFLAFRA